MSARKEQLDITIPLGNNEEPGMVARFSIGLNGGKQEETMVTIDEGYGSIVEAIFNKSGDLEDKRPGIAPNAALRFETISLPEKVTGILPFVKRTEKESMEQRTEAEKRRYIYQKVLEKYPIGLEGNTAKATSGTIIEFPSEREITSTAADE